MKSRVHKNNMDYGLKLMIVNDDEDKNRRRHKFPKMNVVGYHVVLKPE